MRRLMAVVVGVVLALCVAACGPAAKNSGVSSGTSEAATASGGDAATKPAGGGLPIRSNVASFAGRWGLVMVQPIPDERQQPQLREICVALFDFTQDTGPAPLKGTVLATFDKRFELNVERLATEGPTVELDVAGSSGPMGFRGRLADGLVRGTLMSGDGMQPAFLKPTNETAFEGWDAMVVPPGLEVMAEAMRQKNQPAAILAAAKSLRGNPLGLEAYQVVLQKLPQIGSLTEEKVREIVGDYLAAADVWGQRMTDQARFTSAAAVTMTRHYPQLAVELIQQLQEAGRSGPESNGTRPNSWDANLKLLREQAEIDIGLQKLRSTDEALQAAGYQEVKEQLPGQRFNPELLHALGEYALKTGDKPAAQSNFADIVALPMLEAVWLKSREGQPPGDPSPRERLLTLWEEQHGNTDAFEEYVAEIYRQRLAELLDQTKTGGPEAAADDGGKHTVLLELFTGAFCPPCVAGDLAAAVLRQVYPTRLVALQFHQHIPGPDPLANQDSEDRLGYYGIGGTPTAFIDGVPNPSPGVGGYIQHVSQSYGVLRAVVDQRLKTSNAVTITATAHAQNGELSVEAAADGVPEDLLKTVRLRLALAENEVDMAAPNGIRSHEMVVREMLGGAKGVGPKSGKLSYAVQLPLAELKQHLVDYLHQFEVGRDVKFGEKPLVLKPLSLVVWVQNDKTYEVLQTLVVPVTGELTYPGGETADSADAATPANASAGATAR